MASVSIIVPTLNEAENIDHLLNRIFAVQALQDYDFEVIFSDGASTDETCKRVRKWQQSHPVRLLESDVNRGLSAAVIAASQKASGEFFVVMDADLSHPPEKIPDLLKPLVAGSHDMVIGSRYVKGGETPDWPCSRKVCSLLATLPARIFTDVKDPLAGFIAVTRTRLLALTREICGFKFGLELLLTGEQPFAVTEVPITFHDRCYGVSKMSLGVIRDYVHQLLILSGVSLRHSFPTTLVLLLCVIGVAADSLLLDYFIHEDISPGWSQWLSFTLSSAITGAAVLFAAVKRGRKWSPKLLYERLISYSTTVLLVLFLRSGMMYHFAGDSVVTLSECLTLAFASTAVCYTGSVFYVFSIGRKRFQGEPVKRFYIVGIVVYLLIFRLVYSSVLPLLAEEEFYLELAENLVFLDVFTIAYMPASLSAFFLLIAPGSMFAFRLCSFVIWIVSVAFVFCLARDVYNRSVGFRAVMLFTVLPFFSATGLYVTKDAILTLFWAASLYWLYRFLALGEVRSWVLASVVLGWCLVLEPLTVVLGIAVLVCLLVYGAVPGWLKKRKVWVGFTIMGCVWGAFSSLGLSAGQAAAYTGVNWIDEAIGWQISGFVFAPLILMTPVGVFTGILCCIHTGFDDIRIEDVSHSGQQGSDHLCTRTLFLLPMIAGFCLAVFTGNYLFCSTVVWLAALPCISLSLFTEHMLTGPGIVWGKRLKTLWLLMISLIILTYGIVVHLETLI